MAVRLSKRSSGCIALTEKLLLFGGARSGRARRKTPGALGLDGSDRRVLRHYANRARQGTELSSGVGKPSSDSLDLRRRLVHPRRITRPTHNAKPLGRLSYTQNEDHLLRLPLVLDQYG